MYPNNDILNAVPRIQTEIATVKEAWKDNIKAQVAISKQLYTMNAERSMLHPWRWMVQKKSAKKLREFIATIREANSQLWTIEQDLGVLLRKQKDEDEKNRH